MRWLLNFLLLFLFGQQGLCSEVDTKIARRSTSSTLVKNIQSRRYTMSYRWCFWLFSCHDLQYQLPDCLRNAKPWHANYQKCQGLKMCSRTMQYYCVSKVYKRKYHKDISKECCFIIRTSESKGIWLLSDSKYSSANLKNTCGSSPCLYYNYFDYKQTKCLDAFGSYTCCSQTTGAICKKYDGDGSKDNIPGNIWEGPYENHLYDGTSTKNTWHYVTIKRRGQNYEWSNRAGVSWTLYPTNDPNTLRVGDDSPYYANYGHRTAVFNELGVYGPFNEFYKFEGNKGEEGGSCSSECSTFPMAHCGNNPTNQWCIERKLKGANSPERIQSAKYYPKALEFFSINRSWRNCPPWNAWNFDCYQAVRYMLKSNGRESFFHTDWHYFKKGCCTEFQSKCIDKSIIFDNYHFNTRTLACPA